MTLKDTADRAVDAIINDLTDRRGLRQEWEQIDKDTQKEIRETWASLIRLAVDRDLFAPEEDR
jgi:hypothetical protein